VNTTPLLIDAEAAAQLLGVPETWVREKARLGRLPCIRLGRYVRFDPDELIAWARARKSGTVSSRR
jgi:excisionase family DNA binding protein